MRQINIQAGSAPEHIRALVCGLPSAGKTHFAATAERPLFISDASEGGYKTIQAMDPALWWDPAMVPEVRAIESIVDMPTEISRLEALAQQKKFPYRTVIIDPLSIYVDRYLAESMANSPGRDGRQVYGDLATHLRSLVLRVHALPAHVIWLCHLKNDAAEATGPAIGGQMGGKFPAYCDFKWLCNVAPGATPTSAPVFELRTKPYRIWTFLGGRWDLPEVIPPSMKVISQILGMAGTPVSPAVPGFPTGVVFQRPAPAPAPAAPTPTPPAAPSKLAPPPPQHAHPPAVGSFPPPTAARR
jgi:hypothetical protein